MLEKVSNNFIVAQSRIIENYVNNGLLEQNNADYNKNFEKMANEVIEIKDYEGIYNDINEYIEYAKSLNGYKFRNLQFGTELIKILDIYTDKDWRNEALDSDEVDILVSHLKNQLDLINGNITNDEYDELESK